MKIHRFLTLCGLLVATATSGQQPKPADAPPRKAPRVALENVSNRRG